MQDIYKTLLRTNPGISEHDGLFYQKNLITDSEFEQQYTQLRKREGRLYADQIVKKLPEIQNNHLLAKEWRIRKHSLLRLVHFLKTNQLKQILEIGCGNGWLIQNIHRELKTDCCGVDVNETELRQATKIFGGETNLTFLYADITSDLFEAPIADVIIIASAIQYFADPTLVIQKLLKLLHPEGAIHIIDSPFYDQDELILAKERSKKYFLELGVPEMSDNYFHHSWKTLLPFNYKVEHNPDLAYNKLKRRFDNNSPFPWISIGRKSYDK